MFLGARVVCAKVVKHDLCITSIAVPLLASVPRTHTDFCVRLALQPFHGRFSVASIRRVVIVFIALAARGGKIPAQGFVNNAAFEGHHMAKRSLVSESKADAEFRADITLG